MPTYEYTCRDCGEPLEVVQAFTDDPLTVCPNCGGALRKVFGSVGISFKGSGFYKTDSRSSKSSSTSSRDGNGSGDSSSSSDKADTKSDTKSDSKSDGKSDSSSSPSTGSSGSSGDKGGSATKPAAASA